MKITYEESLRNFGFWSGAVQTRELFTDEELDSLESILESEYPEGMNETELNDYFGSRISICVNYWELIMKTII